jgi:hypothetical protein
MMCYLMSLIIFLFPNILFGYKSLEESLNAAEHGDSIAQYIVGSSYGNGIGPDETKVERDSIKALKWIQKELSKII